MKYTKELYLEKHVSPWACDKCSMGWKKKKAHKLQSLGLTIALTKILKLLKTEELKCVYLFNEPK